MAQEVERAGRKKKGDSREREPWRKRRRVASRRRPSKLAEWRNACGGGGGATTAKPGSAHIGRWPAAGRREKGERGLRRELGFGLRGGLEGALYKISRGLCKKKKKRQVSNFLFFAAE